MTKKARKKSKQKRKDAVGVPPGFNRRKKFKGFKDLAEYAKGAVYLIVRIRESAGGTYQVLGTGFLAGEQRMITCAHCINDSRSEDAMSHHADGDLYLFIQKDEDGGYHRYGMSDVKQGTDLFVYEELDIAVFELPAEFYMIDGEYFKHPGMYLELSEKSFNIGTDTAILGYPIPELSFGADGLPDISNVHIRGDKGVVNTRYIKEGVEAYEFTTPFNPGNSGGPILNSETGETIGMVFAYNPIAIDYRADTIPKDVVGNDEEVVVASVIRTTYSIGVSSRNYTDIISKHKLAVRK